MNFLRQLWQWFCGETTSPNRTAPASVRRSPVVEALEERTACAVLGSQIPPSSLSGFVYCDQNRNGIRDAGDTPIPGVLVALVRGTRVVETTFTGLDGSYQFTHLPAGTYTIVRGAFPPSTTMLFAGAYDTVGSIRGESRGDWGRIVQTDVLGNIRLGTSRTGVNYNFAELCNPVLPGIGILKFVDGVHATVSPGVDESGNFTGVVVFTYDVSNPGNVPLSNVVVTDVFSDNNPPPFTKSGSFHPTFVSGDTNGNGLLDPGEVWIYTATRPLVFAINQSTVIYHNVVTVTGTAPNGTTVTATDQGFYNNSEG
jgi:hypothetical protein